MTCQHWLMSLQESQTMPRIKKTNEPWTPERLAILAQFPASEAAAKLGITVEYARTKKSRLKLGPGERRKVWTPENIALLGTMPDTELAKRLGLKQQTVSSARWKYGIPTFGGGRQQSKKCLCPVCGRKMPRKKLK